MTATVDHEKRLTVVEQAVLRIDGAIERIGESLHQMASIISQFALTTEAAQRALADAEKLSDRCDVCRVSVDTRLRDIEIQIPALVSLPGRVQSIEKDMPGLLEMRSWAVRGLLAIVGVLGMAIIGLVVKGV